MRILEIRLQNQQLSNSTLPPPERTGLLDGRHAGTRLYNGEMGRRYAVEVTGEFKPWKKPCIKGKY